MLIDTNYNISFTYKEYELFLQILKKEGIEYLSSDYINLLKNTSIQPLLEQYNNIFKNIENNISNLSRYYNNKNLINDLYKIFQFNNNKLTELNQNIKNTINIQHYITNGGIYLKNQKIGNIIKQKNKIIIKFSKIGYSLIREIVKLSNKENNLDSFLISVTYQEIGSGKLLYRLNKLVSNEKNKYRIFKRDNKFNITIYKEFGFQLKFFFQYISYKYFKNEKIIKEMKITNTY